MSMERLYAPKGWCILANKDELAEAAGVFKVNKYHPKADLHNREPAEIAIKDGERWVKDKDAEPMQALAFTVGLTKIFAHNHKTQHGALKNKPFGLEEDQPLSAENCQIFGEGGGDVNTVKLARVAVLHHEAMTSTLNFGVIMQPDRNGVSDMYAISQYSVFFLPRFMYLAEVKPGCRMRICTQQVVYYACVGLNTSLRLGKIDSNLSSPPHDSDKARTFCARLNINLDEGSIGREAADGKGEASSRSLESLKWFLGGGSDQEKRKYSECEALHMLLTKQRPFGERMAEQLIKAISTIWPDLELSLDSNDMLDISKQLCSSRAYNIPWPHIYCFFGVCSKSKTRRGSISVKKALEDTQRYCGNAAPPVAS